MATEPRNISEEYQKLTDSARRTVVGLVFWSLNQRRDV
jgi:hypothetical protein